MSMLNCKQPEYGEGRTKQAFADSCDINKILKKAQLTGSVAHLEQYGRAVYSEFQGYDLLEAYGKIERARTIFADLPSEVRQEFGGDALKFASYASDPAHIDRLAELIPAIAEPGRYFPNPLRREIVEPPVLQEAALVAAEPEIVPAEAAPAVQGSVS